MAHIYFPTTAIVSLIYTMEEGATAEMVGNEGVVGIALFMGGDTTLNPAVAQVAGGALRITAQALLEEPRRGGPFQLALLRYTPALITQTSQTARGNRPHPVEQRLCRWLLLTRDRLPSGRDPDDPGVMAKVANSGSFKPGQSGNPGGRQKEVGHVRELAETYTTEAIETLIKIMREGAPDRARAAAAEALLDRAWGRAPQHLEVDRTEPLQVILKNFVVDGQTGAVKGPLEANGAATEA